MPAVRTLFNGAPFQIYNPQPVAPKRHLTFTEKLKILDFYHEHKARLTQQQVVTRVKAMGYTSFAQSTLSGYLKDEPRIRAYMSANPSRLHFKQQTSVKLPEVEAALFEWIKQRHGGGIRLTGALICEKAREFCRLFDIPEAQTLKFSNGWLSRLKARFGLRVYKFHGEAASAPIDTLDTEVQRVKELIELYDARDVFNVDETALFFRLPPTTGLAFEQMSGIKADKIRLTYLLGANMDGSEKLKPLVIGRARRPRCFDRVEASDLGFYYFWNSTAWMVQSIWHNFLSDLNTRMAQQHRHILLLIDNAPSHRHTASDYPNLRIEPLAPNLTAWIQPMDAGIIRCFKAHYRNGLTRLVLDRDNAGIEKIYNISQLEGMRLAAAAWDAVSASTIANCWRHTRLASTEESFAQTSDSELAATQTAQALQAEVMQHPNLLEPEFEQMMASLSISPPTERELTDQEIADGVSFVVSF
ncbi:tigger transposable element-derived protein 4 [Ceratobasidium sp. AG-Ba]|nr:tigger transposable element-derived protein 4 [Ceratobasidium sp. AG-Ba]QRV81830.1 tigger transposable element-derived protein 4 [Ceratobasidium sp. AG-Ba]